MEAAAPVVATGTLTTCPECLALLPPVRSETPWCECGWSSAPDPVIEQVRVWARPKEKAKIERRMARDRETARARAKRDLELLQQRQESASRRLRWSSNMLLAAALVSIIQGLRAILFLVACALIAVSAIHKVWVLVLVGVAGILLTWLLFRTPRKDPGYMLKPEGTPELHKLVADLAQKGQTKPPAELRLSRGSNFAAYTRIRWLPWPRLEHVVVIGLLSMHTATRAQFQAIVAHELAHFRNWDTVIGLYVDNALGMLGDWTRPELGLRHGIPVGCNPVSWVIWLLRGAAVLYYRLLVQVTAATMRRQELLADQFAAQLTSAEAFTSSLIQLGAFEAAFADHASSIGQLIGSGRDTRDWYTQFNARWASLAERHKQRYYSQAVASFRSRYDSHPTYQDRYAALRPLETHTKEPCEGDLIPALSLLPNAQQIGEALTQRWLEVGNRE
jgi:Zn-dependent protease with chaperone function